MLNSMVGVNDKISEGKYRIEHGTLPNIWATQQWIYFTITSIRQEPARGSNYLDIRKSLDPSIDREEAIMGVPEDKIVRTNFGRDVMPDLSSSELDLEKPIC